MRAPPEATPPAAAAPPARSRGVHELLAGILGKVVPACHYFASAQLLP